MDPRLTHLLSLSRKELAVALRAGHPIEPSALDDLQYRGVSLGMPAWVDKLAWKKFRKTFHRDPSSGHLRGWNVRLEQDGLDAPSTPMTVRGGDPKTFGHYRVVQTDDHKMPAGTDRGLLIHYGLGGNGLFDVTRLFRDPIVAVDAGDPGFLLGWSYVDLGLFKVPTPSYFSLEVEGPVDYIATPPRA